MKKVTLVLLVFLFVLSGCTLFEETTKKEPTDILDYSIYEAQSAITQTIEDVEDSCVGILNQLSTGAATGSGVIIKVDNDIDIFGNERYYVITNYHVVESHVSLKVYLGRDKYGDIYINASYIGGDSEDDLALISFETTRELKVASLGLDESLVRGQFVIAIGCPLQFTLFNTSTLGIISNITSTAIQHDSAINPGNSGGGLFNLSGKLIGINNSKYTTSGGISVEGIGFAISCEVVDEFMKNVFQDVETSERPLVGITVIEYNTYIAYYDQTNIPEGLDGGLVITAVTEGGSGESAGLEEYDVILKADGLLIYVRDELSSILDGKKKGDTISFVVRRGEEEKTIDVLLK